MKPENLTPENRFLISCIKTGYDKDASRMRAELFPDIRWDITLKKAYTHHVAPMISYAFHGACGNFPVPASLRGNFDIAYQYVLQRNIFIYGVADKIINIFKDNCVPFLFIRGPVLGKSIYPDIALRPMSDLDILIKKEHRQKAHSLLHQLGYQTFIPSYNSQAIYVNDKSEMPLEIELHWDLEPRFEKNVNEVWQNTCPAEIGGRPVLTLRTEALLAHLLTHLNKHIRRGETKLIWIFDIYLLIHQRGQNLDWDYFAAKTKENNLEEPIYGMLHLVKELFEISLPQPVIDRLESAGFPYSEKDIFDPDPKNGIMHISQLSETKGIINKIRYATNMLFPAKSFMARFYSEDRKTFSYTFYLYRFYRALVIIFNTLGYKIRCALKRNFLRPGTAMPVNLLYFIKKRPMQHANRTQPFCPLKNSFIK